MLKLELAKHPDRQLVNYLCNGLTFGFNTLISNTEVSIKKCKNLRSAITQPEIVDKLIESEVSKGFFRGTNGYFAISNFPSQFYRGSNW